MEFYNRFADVYDNLVSFNNRVKREANFYNSLFKKYKINNVLDCACGTGHHVMMLKQMGYNVKGSDLSPAMIKKARENLRENRLDIPLNITDFRKLSETFYEKFDALICVGNSLPHLMSDEDISQALAEMNAILNKDGILILEQRNYDKLVKEKRRFFPMSFSENEVFFYVLDFGTSTIIFNIININIPDQTFQIYSTKYNILKMEKLRELLNISGFTIVECYEDYEFNKFSIENSERPIVLCEKSRK